MSNTNSLLIIDFQKELDIHQITQILRTSDSVFVSAVLSELSLDEFCPDPELPLKFVKVPLLSCHDKCALG